MTLNNLMVRFQQCWSFGECGVPLYCHCSQVHSGVAVLGYQWSKKKAINWRYINFLANHNNAVLFTELTLFFCRPKKNTFFAFSSMVHFFFVSNGNWAKSFFFCFFLGGVLLIKSIPFQNCFGLSISLSTHFFDYSSPLSKNLLSF